MYKDKENERDKDDEEKEERHKAQAYIFPPLSFPFLPILSPLFMSLRPREGFFRGILFSRVKGSGNEIIHIFFSSLSSLFIPLLFCLPVMQPDSGNFPLFVDFLKGKGGAGLK